MSVTVKLPILRLYACIIVCLSLIWSTPSLAAPDFNVSPVSLVWDETKGDIRIGMEFRRDVSSVDIRVIDSQGAIIHNEQLFNLRAGLNTWEWDGRIDRKSLITPGLYRLVLMARFLDGLAEQEVIQLRVTEPRPATGAQVGGYAPPAIKPFQPSYRINGDFSVLRRFDSENDEAITETRLNFRYADRGEDFNLDTNLGYFRRSNGIENSDSSYALYQRFWDNGSADLVYRRSLGFFNDPLRLFSDFRAQNDKIGGRVQQQFSAGQLSILGYEGHGSTTGTETGAAARWKGNLSDSLSYGLGATSRLNRNGSSGNSTNNAYGLDLEWAVAQGHKLAAQYVSTSTDDDSGLASAIDGNGHGSRFSWHYLGQSGLRTSLGYLDLSENYNAALSDPGNQIVSDAKGPELTIDYFLPESSSDWLKDIAIGFRTFSYERYSDNPDIKQVDVLAQALVKNAIRFTGNYRRRDDNDNVTTTVLLSEQHNWTESWRGGIQYTGVKTTGIKTQRVLISANTGNFDRFHRVGLELGRRSGSTLADGALDEIGLLANGRFNNIVYEGLVRQTTDDNDDDVNVFGLIGYEKLFLHRYRALAFLALGDRSARQIAGRVEVGVSLRF